MEASCVRVSSTREGQAIWIISLYSILDSIDRDEQFSKALTLMGDGHFVFEGGAPLLAALLDVLKEAVNDQYDYISWWLYDAAPDYEVWTDDEKTKWCLKEPEALYDFIRDECQG